jgi:cellulose synthase operon protein C
MRRLNGKLFLILLASVTLCGALVHALHAFQVHRHSGMFLREAERAEKSGRFDESADYLRRYLLLAPDDVEALSRLAKLNFDHHQDRQAQLLYSQVIHQQPNNEEARRRLVDASIRLGAYQDAKYQLEGFLLKSHADEGDLYLQLGSCQQALGDYLGAKASYERAIHFAPDHTSAYARLAELEVDRLERAGDAVPTLNSMIARNPKSGQAYLLRAAFLQSHAGNTQVQSAVLKDSNVTATERPRELLRRALSDAKAATERSPNDAKTLLFASQAALSGGSLDEAKDFAERARKISPAEPLTYVILASYELRQDRMKAAVDCLKRGLEATKDNPLVVLTLANFNLDAKDIQAARPLIDRLRRIETFSPVVRYLDSRILIDESKWDDAASRLRGMSSELARWPQFQKESQFWLAHCYSRLVRNDLRIAAYRSALDIDPLWPPARMGLAEALRDSGRIDESLLEYQRMMRLPNVPTQASIAGLRLAIAKNLSLPPNEQRSWGAIEKQLAEIARHLSSENSLVLNAEIESAEDKLTESLQSLRSAISANPKDSTAWTNLVELETRNKQWGDAEKLLGAMQKQFSDGVPFRLAKAEYLLRRLGDGAKDGLRVLADPLPSYSVSDRVRLANGLARAALAVRDYEQAGRLCRIVATHDPANLQIRLVLFDLAQQSGQKEALEKALKEVDAIEHHGFYSRYGDAVRLFILGREKKDEHLLDQALERAAEARLQRPDSSRPTLLSAEINDYRGRRDAAVDGYSTAVDLGERDPRVVSRLVSLLSEQGNYSKADLLIKKLQEEKNPFSTELTRLASQTSVRTGDFNRALAMARQAAAKSTDVRDHIWLGQMLSVSGDANEAEVELKKATQDAPKYSAGWIQLIQFYKTTGKKDLAKKALEQAKTKIDAKQTPLALAYACEQVGEIAEAEQYYLAAIKATPREYRLRQAMVEFESRNGKRKEAEALVRELITIAGESKDKATLLWARRTLAGLLISAGTQPQYAEAVKWINQNLADSPGSDPDRRMSALAEASQANRESRQKAVEHLEALSQRPGVLTLDDQLLLARLYWSAGARTKAMQRFRTVAMQSRSPESTLAYTEALIDEKEISEAEIWLRRLEQLAPNQFGTIVVRARLLARQDRYNEAYDSLIKFIDSDTADARTRLARRRLASMHLEEFGTELVRRGRKQESARFFTQAEAYLADSDGDSKQPSLAHVRFLIRRGRHDDAVTEVERLRQAKDPDAVSKACLALAQLGTNEHSLLDRAKGMAEQVANEHPSADAWIALGALQDRLESYDAAEQSYRRGLALAATRIDALNNLAYLLALQKKELPEARTLVNRAIEAGGPRGALRDSLAMIELAIGDADSALSDADQACSEDPNPVHLFHLARLRLMKGDRKAALAALQKAREGGLTPASLHALERSTLTELETQLEVPAS